MTNTAQSQFPLSYSNSPIAAGRKSRRLRRPTQRTFAPKRDLNRPKTRPLVRPPLERATVHFALRPGRSDKPGRLVTVEASPGGRRAVLRSAKPEAKHTRSPVLETPKHAPPKAATLPSSLAKGTSERQQAKPNAPASKENLPYTSESTRSARATPTIKTNFFLSDQQARAAAYQPNPMHTLRP